MDLLHGGFGAILVGCIGFIFAAISAFAPRKAANWESKHHPKEERRKANENISDFEILMTRIVGLVVMFVVIYYFFLR